MRGEAIPVEAPPTPPVTAPTDSTGTQQPAPTPNGDGSTPTPNGDGSTPTPNGDGTTPPPANVTPPPAETNPAAEPVDPDDPLGILKDKKKGKKKKDKNPE
jgi:hypothetical protein